MKRERFQNITGLLFGILVFGIMFVFTGCGDLIKIYDPISLEYRNWTPFNIFLMNRDPLRGNKIRLLDAFYKAFPGTEKTRVTNEDVLKKVDEYCSAKQSGYSKEQMDRLIEEQIALVALILNQSELNAVAEEVTLGLKTVYDLADEYVCPRDYLSDIFNDSNTVELYIKAVKQRGFDESIIDEVGKSDLDRTILLAGRTACEEIEEYGYQKALEQKLNEFSSDDNIRAAYSSAYEYLCPDISSP